MTLRDHAESLRRERIHLAHRHAVLAALGAGSDPADAIAALGTAVAAATTARVCLLLVSDPITGALTPIGPAMAGRRVIGRPGQPLPVDDAPPYRAIRQGSVVVDAGPAREATGWGRLCSALAMGVVLVAPMRHRGDLIGVVVVGDPEDTTTATSALQAVADDAATVVAVTRRVEVAEQRSDHASEIAALSSDLVATVSHELRTPLTSIVGSLQTLERLGLASANPDAGHMIETALTQTHRLRVLVDDLLLTARLDRGSLPTRVRPVDPVALAGDIVAMVPGAADRIIVIESDARPVLIDGDHAGRIVRNLIENVVDHSGDSRGEVVVSGSDGFVDVAVVDHGPGIDPERIPTLFERGTASGEAGGLGLGLAIAHGLADAMGATITYSPTPGGGSTFTVKIPTGSKAG